MTRCLLVFPLIAVLFLAGCPDAGEGGDGVDETGDSVVLAYTPPAGWTAGEIPDVGFYVSVYQAPDQTGGIMMSAYTVYMVPGKNLAGATKQYVEHIDPKSSLTKNAKLISNKTINVGQVEAQEIIWSYEPVENATIVNRSWLVVGKTDAYNLTAQFVEADYKKHEAELDAVAQSLRWEKAPPEQDE